MKRSHLLHLLISATLISACQPIRNAMGFDQPLDFQHSEIDQVTYRFTDSSVPPPYHRSYSIIVTAETINLTVDSYGDIVAQQTLPSSTEQFQAVLAALDEARIRPGQASEREGCTGGTGDRITAHREDESIFDAYRYNCGQQSGPMQGDVAAVKAHFQSLIPDFSALIRV
jgi:hypothetical protein